MSSAVFCVDSVYPRAINEHPEELFILYVMKVQKRSGRTFRVFRVIERRHMRSSELNQELLTPKERKIAG
jgi:hypothetical protein